MSKKLTVGRALGAAAFTMVSGQILKSVYRRMTAGEKTALHGATMDAVHATNARTAEDIADEAARESFPASDPPSWTPTATNANSSSSPMPT